MTEIEKLQKAHDEAAQIFDLHYNVRNEKENADYFNGVVQGLHKAMQILRITRLMDKENKMVFPETIENLIKEHKRRVFQARRDFKMSIIEGLKMSAVMKIIRDSTNANNAQKVEAIWEIITF